MTDAILYRVYLWGYTDHAVPRWVRWAVAKSGLWRTRILGFHGFFE